MILVRLWWSVACCWFARCAPRCGSGLAVRCGCASADCTTRRSTGATTWTLIRNASEATRGQEGGEIEGFGPYSPGRNSSLNSLGQRGQSNNFLLNGMDNNEIWLRGAVFEPSWKRSKRSASPAVYVPSALGHAAGATIDVRPGPAPSSFHGSVFDYLQNSALNARNFFDGARKPGLAQSQFGGNVGGPVRKGGGFFFANLERRAGTPGPHRDFDGAVRGSEGGQFRQRPDLRSAHHHRGAARRYLSACRSPAIKCRPHGSQRRRANCWRSIPIRICPAQSTTTGSRRTLVRSSDTPGRQLRQVSVAEKQGVGPSQLRKIERRIAGRLCRRRADRTPGATRSSTPTARTPG